MKLHTFLISILLYTSSCSRDVSTNESCVKKIIETTEYLVLDSDFNKPDTTRHQKNIKKVDENNNVLEEADFWGADEAPSGGLIFKYNNENRKVAQYLLNARKEVTTEYAFDYSENTAVRFEVSEHNDRIKRGIDYLDENANVIRETSLYGDGRIMTDFHYKYNAANQQTERGGNMDGKSIGTNYMIYDSIGNLIQQRSTDSTGVVLSVEKFTTRKLTRTANGK
ncbi:hypothetical protein WBG78_04755 [Chryseolinea sp. T2]|uniref:hypothetical protein n=1 Tax=Chryseolinea sp. T2 TaxID=3129255 RepID=UPI0030773DD9